MSRFLFLLFLIPVIWLSIPIRQNQMDTIHYKNSPWILVGKSSELVISERYFILTGWQGDIRIDGKRVWGKIYERAR